MQGDGQLEQAGHKGASSTNHRVASMAGGLTLAAIIGLTTVVWDLGNDSKRFESELKSTIYRLQLAETDIRDVRRPGLRFTAAMGKELRDEFILYNKTLTDQITGVRIDQAKHDSNWAYVVSTMENINKNQKVILQRLRLTESASSAMIQSHEPTIKGHGK